MQNKGKINKFKVLLGSLISLSLILYFFFVPAEQLKVSQNTNGTEALSNQISTKVKDDLALDAINSKTTFLSSEFSLNNAQTNFYRIIMLQDKKHKQLELTQLFAFWIDSDPLHLFNFLNKQPIDTEYYLLLNMFFDIWIKHDVYAFSNWLQQVDLPQIYDNAILYIIEQNLAPEHISINWVKIIKDAKKQQQATHLVLKNWAIDAPKQAVFWAIDSHTPATYLRQIFHHIAQINVESAIVMMALLEEQTSTVIYEAGLGLSEAIEPSNVGQQILVTASLLPSHVKEVIYNIFVPLFVKLDPKEVIHAINSMPQGLSRDIVERTMLLSWAATDSLSAGQYIEDMPAGKKRSWATLEVVNNWQQGNLSQASDWLTRQQTIINVDIAASVLAGNAAELEKNRDLALDWLNKIEDVTVRTDTLWAVISSWYEYDADAALQYLHSVNYVPPEKIESFSRELNSSKP